MNPHFLSTFVRRQFGSGFINPLPRMVNLLHSLHCLIVRLFLLYKADDMDFKYPKVTFFGIRIGMIIVRSRVLRESVIKNKLFSFQRILMYIMAMPYRRSVAGLNLQVATFSNHYPYLLHTRKKSINMLHFMQRLEYQTTILSIILSIQSRMIG